MAWAGDATEHSIAATETRTAAAPRRNDPLLPITPQSVRILSRALLLEPVPRFVITESLPALPLRRTPDGIKAGRHWLHLDIEANSVSIIA